MKRFLNIYLLFLKNLNVTSAIKYIERLELGDKSPAFSEFAAPLAWERVSLSFSALSGAKMIYFLDNSRQEKATAIAVRLDDTMRDKNVKVIHYCNYKMKVSWQYAIMSSTPFKRAEIIIAISGYSPWMT